MIISRNVKPGPSLNLIVYPSNLVGAGRVGKIAKSLQSSGEFDETHAIGMRINGDALLPDEELAPGVRNKRIATFDSPFSIGRALAQELWALRVVRRYAKQNVKAVSAQRAIVLPLVYRLARKTGAVFAYNPHELETEALGFTGLKQRVLRFIERRYIKHADVISVVNESIAEWYMETYPHISRPIVLTNTPMDDGNSFDLKRKLGIPNDELLYVHVGYISPGRNIPLILRAFAANPKVHVVFLGDGVMRNSVDAAAEQHPNIHWCPMVPPDSVVAYVRGADIGLCLIEYTSLSYELSTPNKLMESWVAGIPPLCSDLREARSLLGVEASRTWVLESPVEQLSAALDRITVADVKKFKKSWKPVPSWDAQASSLVDAYIQAAST